MEPREGTSVRQDRLAEIGVTLKWGFLADDTLWVLEKYRQTHQLTALDRSTLKKAFLFLKKVVEGSESSKAAEISGDAVDSIVTYNQARFFLSLSPGIEKSADDMDRALNELTNTIENLIRGKPIENGKLVALTNFFDIVGRSTLGRSTELLRSEEMYKIPA